MFTHSLDEWNNLGSLRQWEAYSAASKVAETAARYVRRANDAQRLLTILRSDVNRYSEEF